MQPFLYASSRQARLKKKIQLQLIRKTLVIETELSRFGYLYNEKFVATVGVRVRAFVSFFFLTKGQ